MKTLSSLLICSAILFVGCMNDSSKLTSTDAQINQQSNSPGWVKISPNLGNGSKVETLLSTEKIITGEDGGMINLDVVIPRPGNPLGDFEVHVTVQVQAHSFPDQEQRLFTVILDPEYSMLYISPAPNTLNKKLLVDFKIRGIDVDRVDPETFCFICVGDNNQIMETEKQVLQLNETQIG